jgi:hypothetical protein
VRPPSPSTSWPPAWIPPPRPSAPSPTPR